MQLNGVTIYPTDAPKKKRKSGTTLIADDGTRRYVQRVTGGGSPIIKHEWPLSWEGVANSVRAQIETIANLSTTMTYVDQLGASYTVQCESESYEDSVAFVDAAGVAYYNISLTIFEA